MGLNPIRLPMKIDVPLRGKRTYIQSASLFDFLVDSTAAVRNVSLSFRRKIECEVEARAAAGLDAERFPARFSGESDRQKIELVIAERLPMTPIARREAYDEAAVVDGSRIDGFEILSHAGNGASVIDRIVALNKRLIAQAAGTQKTLIFAKIFLSAIPPGDPTLRLRLRSRLGTTLFRSRVFAGDSEIGEITFYGI